MKALSPPRAGNVFAANLGRAGRITATHPDVVGNQRAPLRQSVALLPQDRESAMPARTRCNTPTASAASAALGSEKAMRALLQAHGLVLPEPHKHLRPSELATNGAAINAAIATLNQHGTVAQGVAHACRTGDNAAFKAVMALASANVLDVNAAPGSGEPLLAMLCAADGVSDIRQRSPRESYAIYERVEMLAERNADFGLRDAQGNSLLHLAAEHDADTELIHALIDYASGKLTPAVVNANGQTALHTGLRAGCSARTVRALFSLGVDLSARDAAGRTALHVAAAHALTPTVLEALLNNGAKLHDTSEQGRTALHYAAAQSQNPEIIALLINRGADMQARDKDGNTASLLVEARNLVWPVPAATKNDPQSGCRRCPPV